MTAKELKRKLAAIPSADGKGYSRLMGQDEECEKVLYNSSDLKNIRKRKALGREDLFGMDAGRWER